MGRDSHDQMGSIGFYTLSDDRCRRVASGARQVLARCEILLGARCNFRCSYCRGVGGPDAQLEAVIKTVDLWSQQGLRAIRFSGGEPTLFGWLPEVVSYASRTIDRVAVSTNGSAPWITYQKLLDAGVNDFSVSLDSCCASGVKRMAGGVDAFDVVVENIRRLSECVYVTVGIVLTNENQDDAEKVLDFAASLGVSDMRPIPAAQDGAKLNIRFYATSKYPILRWRLRQMASGAPVRGISDKDSSKCSLVLDDMAVIGDKHYPCIIYLREGGAPIGTVCSTMRQDRERWFANHDSKMDSICRRNCLDFCVKHNNRVEEFRLLRKRY